MASASPAAAAKAIASFMSHPPVSARCTNSSCAIVFPEQNSDKGWNHL